MDYLEKGTCPIFWYLEILTEMYYFYLKSLFSVKTKYIHVFM